MAQTPDPESTVPGGAVRAAGHVRRESILRERARRVVAASGPPTLAFSTPRRESQLAAETERSVLDLVLRVGEAMIATGAPVADVTAALLRLAAAYGVTNCHVDITFISISASIDRDDDPITKLRVISVRTSDYSRLTELFLLVEDSAAGRLPLEDAHARLERVLRAPHPYRRWIVTGALGAMAGGVAFLLGGGWQVALVAALTTVIIDRVLRVLRRWGLPYIFQQAAGAGIATLVALVLLWGQDLFGWDRSLLPPSLVVASGIVVLLAGLQLVGAAEDAISGFPLTAAAKTFEVALYTTGLVIGIGFVLDMGQRLGVPLVIGDVFGSSPPAFVQVLCGAVIAGSWAVASYTQARNVWLISLVGAVATGTYYLVDTLWLGPAGAAFFAALVVGLIGGVIGDRGRLPSFVVSVCGVTPMLPGLSIYAAMFSFIESGDLINGGQLAIRALSVGLALAAGVTLGEFCASPLRSEMDRWERRVRTRARGARI
ncbi:threonine/serine exporter family protein [Georgenia sp. 311]|uniref:Threonine/serine exporter family protein n=1 Tax=Georgenia wutianyii TaxID=2585135 RepID=A0ABX5VLJ3_9MICO|nr:MULTISPECIES: threonine/serine exporter family protein [Georgenia]QDB79354.1 threonine/serine exporter family protein [Georgenia wutianyii]TNC17435.1 threonine/serine exporter family protein [Georgenia sp. 311]